MTPPPPALLALLLLTGRAASASRRPAGRHRARSSSMASARAPGSTSSRRSCAGTRWRAAALRPRQGRPPGHRVPRGRFTDPELGGPVNLWVSAIDSVASVITLSSSVGARISSTAGARPSSSATAGSTRQVQGSQWMMQWVRQRPHAAAHLAHRARREDGLGEPGGWTRPRRVARRAADATRRGQPRQPHQKASLGFLQHVVPHHRPCFPQRAEQRPHPSPDAARRRRPARAP